MTNKIQFILRKNSWAYQGREPQDIMKELGAKVEKVKIDSNRPDDEYLIVSLSPKQISEMLSNLTYNTMVINHMALDGWKMICFDAPGKVFQQRG